jgi:hypothetical protein
MPLIQFTIDDKLDALGAPHDNISLEENAACDGRRCGTRPALEDHEGNPLQGTSEYIALYGSGRVTEHSHIVSSRNHPGARCYVHKCF